MIKSDFDANFLSVMKSQNLPNGRLLFPRGVEAYAEENESVDPSHLLRDATVVGMLSGNTWSGDLDLERDSAALKTAAAELDESLCVLTEPVEDPCEALDKSRYVVVCRPNLKR